MAGTNVAYNFKLNSDNLQRFTISNNQSVSSKIQPMKNPNFKNIAMASCSKKEYVIHAGFGKENIDVSNKQSELTKASIDDCYLFTHEKYRKRKASDSIIFEKKRDISVLSEIKNLIFDWETREQGRRHFSETEESSRYFRSYERDFEKSDLRIYTSSKKIPKPSAQKPSSKKRLDVLRDDGKITRKLDNTCNIIVEERLKLLNTPQEENKNTNSEIEIFGVQEFSQEDKNETSTKEIPKPAQNSSLESHLEVLKDGEKFIRKLDNISNMIFEKKLKLLKRDQDENKNTNSKIQNFREPELSQEDKNKSSTSTKEILKPAEIPLTDSHLEVLGDGLKIIRKLDNMSNMILENRLKLLKSDQDENKNTNCRVKNLPVKKFLREGKNETGTSTKESLKSVQKPSSESHLEVLRDGLKIIRKLDNISNMILEKRLKLLKSDQEENKNTNSKIENIRLQEVSQKDKIDTPVDVPPKPINRKKIKLEHRKYGFEERYQQIHKDNLPTKLCYNVEYIDDFMQLQLLLEQSHHLSPDFLKKNINRNQRRMVISFLIKVTAVCKYPSFILFQTVRIFDTMLDLNYIDIDELQLVGLTSLWITLKRIHIIADLPTANEILEFSKGEYTEQDLFKCEVAILATLRCEISFIDPFAILAYFIMSIKNPVLEVKNTDMVYYCASYLIDVSLLSSTLCMGSTIILIIAAAELALFITLAKGDDFINPDWLFWRNSLPKGFNDERELNALEIELTRNRLINLALLYKSDKSSSKNCSAVYQKYKSARYGRISDIVIGRLQKLFQSIAN